MKLSDYLKLYFAVKAECKRKYKRDFNERMHELLDAYRMEG